MLPANAPSPTNYRVPNVAEIPSLLNSIYVISAVTSRNGVSSRSFTDKTNGESIFLPFVGYRDECSGILVAYGINDCD